MLGQFAPFHCIASVGRAVRILWAAFFFIPAKVGERCSDQQSTPPEGLESSGGVLYSNIRSIVAACTPLWRRFCVWSRISLYNASGAF